MRTAHSELLINKDYARFVETPLLINGEKGAKGDSFAFGKLSLPCWLSGGGGRWDPGLIGHYGAEASSFQMEVSPILSPSPGCLRDLLPETLPPPCLRLQLP